MFDMVWYIHHPVTLGDLNNHIGCILMGVGQNNILFSAYRKNSNDSNPLKDIL